MGKFSFLFRYLNYILCSKDEHSIHSPFIFDLYTQVIRVKKRYYLFDKIESIWERLISSNRKITVTDFGAGSKAGNTREKEVATIVRRSEKPAQHAQVLFRLVERFKPSVTFDLGTSFGLTTLYLATASSKNRIITFEGCPQTASIARENFNLLKLKNIHLVEGNLDQTLDSQIASVPQIDFAFFDANHRYSPTLRYFQACLQKAHQDSVFVFDDIHWSEEMEKAWEEIKNHPRVMLTIDLFYMGLVFFRTQQPKQHFILKL